MGKKKKLCEIGNCALGVKDPWPAWHVGFAMANGPSGRHVCELGDRCVATLWLAVRCYETASLVRNQPHIRALSCSYRLLS